MDTEARNTVSMASGATRNLKILLSSLEKPEDFSAKKEGPSEAEVFQQVIAELRTEVKALKEQVEQEKKITSDVKSLKTQQISTLTSKLANAVRQREQAENELAKVNKEMEELKEVAKAQAEEIKTKESKDDTDGQLTQDEHEAQQCGEEETGEVNKQDKTNANDDIALFCLEKDSVENDSVDESAVKNGNDEDTALFCLEKDSVESDSVDESAVKNGNDEDTALFCLEKDSVESDSVDESAVKNGNDEDIALFCLEKDSVESESVDELAVKNANDEDIALFCLEKDSVESEPVDELEVNGNGSLQLENNCDQLSMENSLHENSSKEELYQGVSRTEDSQSSSELSYFSLTGNLSVQDDSHEDVLIHLEDLQNSPSEMFDSNHVNPSFKTHEENPKETEETPQEFTKIQEDLCEVQEKLCSVSKISRDVNIVAEKRLEIIETTDLSSARKNRRIRTQNSEEEQESSPPTSPEAVSSGYTSNSADEKLANLLMNHGMADDHTTAMFPGNDSEEQEVHSKGFLVEYDDVIGGSKRAQDEKALEGFITREQVVTRTVLTNNYTNLEERCLSSNTMTDGGENDARKSSEQQNNFMSQVMSEEVEDLKQQLKNAVKEIGELRLENKEMKKEIQNLSSSTAEQAFLVKTTKFTDRLLREMKERETKVHVSRRHSAYEKYGLDRECGYQGITEQGQMRTTGEVMNRSARRKVSMPLKLIGAKLKEITRSVENMAIDTDLPEETFSDECAPDFVDYEHLLSTFNDHFELEESLTMETESSKTLAAQSAPFKHENRGKYQEVLVIRPWKNSARPIVFLLLQNLSSNLQRKIAH
ncbi:hypothetical protein OS493_004275 [Desmophyllum pertusum]|uniref:Uncharacterized protein n=1 Tax=Desmophyllum pertusum TaxID=174260 RepID=A0A9W9ZTS8_9CNID|nr:hypothetical protein OS493_004275 [Desmophyllum pertusum]